ncbi:MAG: phage major capsid protein [Bacteroidota bacterium]
MVALVAGTASVHAETFGVEPPRTGDLQVAVDHYVGFTGHADDGSAAPLSLRADVPTVASSTAGQTALGLAILAAVLVVDSAGLDPTGGVAVLATGPTLATIGKTVEEIKAAQTEHIERQQKLNEETEKGLRGESEAREEMNDRLGDLVDTVEATQKAVLKIAQAGGRPDVSGTLSDEDRAENEAFADYVRKGERGMSVDAHGVLTTGFAEARELSTDDLSSGGVFVPENMSDRIIERVYERSPIRRNATVDTITRGDNLQVVKESDTKDFTSGWVGERDARGDTDTEAYELITIPVHEQFAQPTVTNKMLEDSFVGVEGRIERGLGNRFSLEEGIGFVTGNGIHKPLGFLSAKTLAVFAALSAITKSGDANAIPDWKSFAKAMTSLPSAYQEAAKWYWNRTTTFVAITFVDGEGRPLINFDLLREGGGMQFLGHEIEHVDAMPAYDLETGQYTTGDAPVLFADMEEMYNIVDRRGMVTIRDNVTKKGFTKFYTSRRVGGQTVQHNAGRLIRIEA